MARNPGKIEGTSGITTAAPADSVASPVSKGDPMTRTDLKPENRKLQTRALCARYGVTTRTIDRWVETGVLPQPFRINRVRYWHESDVEELDKSRATAAASSAA